MSENAEFWGMVKRYRAMCKGTKEPVRENQNVPFHPLSSYMFGRQCRSLSLKFDDSLHMLKRSHAEQDVDGFTKGYNENG